MSDKNLLEFLKELRDCVDSNIYFLNEMPEKMKQFSLKYFDELVTVQNIINSFDFVNKEKKNED